MWARLVSGTPCVDLTCLGTTSAHFRFPWTSSRVCQVVGARVRLPSRALVTLVVGCSWGFGVQGSHFVCGCGGFRRSERTNAHFHVSSSRSSCAFVESPLWWRLNQAEVSRRFDDFQSKQFRVRFRELGLGVGSVLPCPRNEPQHNAKAKNHRTRPIVTLQLGTEKLR